MRCMHSISDQTCWPKVDRCGGYDLAPSSLFVVICRVSGWSCGSAARWNHHISFSLLASRLAGHEVKRPGRRICSCLGKEMFLQHDLSSSKNQSSSKRLKKANPSGGRGRGMEAGEEETVETGSLSS